MDETHWTPRPGVSGFREWMAVVVMLSGGFCMALMVSAMAPVAHQVALYFAKNGDGELIAQTIATVPSIGIIIGGPVAGWLIDRVGPRLFLIAAMALFAVSGSAGLYLDDATGLLVSRLVLGMTVAGIMTATITAIGDYFTPEARARILGYQSSLGALSGVAAIFGAGQIGEAGGWRAPFTLYLLGFLFMILTALFLPALPKRAKPAVQTASRAAAGGEGSILGLWPIYLMIIPMFVAVYIPNIQVPFLLADDGVTRPSTQSFVILTGAAVVALGAALFGTLRRHLSSGHILRLCFALQGAGIAILGFSHTPVMAGLGCGVLGMGTGLSNPLLGDLIIARAAPHLRSRALGASYTARYAGSFLNPMLIRPLAVAAGLHTAFLMIAAAFIAGVAVSILAVRMPRGAAGGAE